MDNPTRRLNEAPLTPTAARPCLRCQTPMFNALVRAKYATGWRPIYYPLRLQRLVENSLLWGKKYAETGCSVWVCPDCGYTELAANNPTALLEGR